MTTRFLCPDQPFILAGTGITDGAGNLTDGTNPYVKFSSTFQHAPSITVSFAYNTNTIHNMPAYNISAYATTYFSGNAWEQDWGATDGSSGGTVKNRTFYWIAIDGNAT